MSFRAKTCYPHTWKDHCCFGHIINCAFRSKIFKSIKVKWLGISLLFVWLKEHYLATWNKKFLFSCRIIFHYFTLPFLREARLFSLFILSNAPLQAWPRSCNRLIHEIDVEGDWRWSEPDWNPDPNPLKTRLRSLPRKLKHLRGVFWFISFIVQAFSFMNFFNHVVVPKTVVSPQVAWAFVSSTVTSTHWIIKYSAFLWAIICGYKLQRYEQERTNYLDDGVF